MPWLAVSACLAGICCRHDAAARRRDDVYALWKAGAALALCPEVLGGLPVPRPPCEIGEGHTPPGLPPWGEAVSPDTLAASMLAGVRVYRRDGTECTDAYVRGAREAVRQALMAGCRVALLQARSPACGVGLVYDGSFNHRLVPGSGVFARLARAAGLEVHDAGHVPDAAHLKP